MDKLRIAFVGCGEIAVAGAKSISQTRNIELGMFMDTVEHLAKDLSEKYKAPYTTNLDDVLGDRDIDAIYTPTPHYLHAPIAIEAAKSGKHVIVEKPIATTLADAKAMIRECRRNHVVLSIALVRRCGAAAAKARNLVQAGVIGTVFATEIRFLTRKPWSYWDGGFSDRVKTSWRKSKEMSGGGVLIMNCVHDIDWVRYVTGLEVNRVFSECGTFKSPSDVKVEDTIALSVRYEGGAIGWIAACSSAEGSRSLEGSQINAIYGTDGQVLLSSNKLKAFTTKGEEGLVANSWQDIPLESYDSRAKFFDEFARAVLSGTQPPATGEDGLKALEIILAAYKSAEKGRPVRLPTRM